MPQCHKCPHAAEIEAGQFLGAKWEDTPCASCLEVMTDALSHKGKTHVQYNSDMHDKPDPVDPESEDITALFWLSYAMKAILSLPPKTREIVIHRLAYPGRPLRMIAAQVGLKKSSVHGHLKKARADWPALQKAIPMQTWKWGDGETPEDSAVIR